MSISNYAEDLFLDQLPATLYAQLHTGNPGEDGTSNVAQNSTRKQFTKNGTSGNTRDNAGAMTWSPAGYAETYTHVSVWDHVSAGEPTGHCYFYGALTASVAVGASDDFTIAAGDLVMSLD